MPRPIDSARRVLIVAAHPDDDVIGCGGLMSSIARAGGSVFVVYLTDGSGSHPGSRRFPPKRLAVLREQEARSALQLLGISEAPAFFLMGDGTLGSLPSIEREAAIRRLVEGAEAFVPDLVLAPWRRDPHPDHMAASAIARDAVQRLSFSPDVAEYEVWLAVRGSKHDRPTPRETDTREIALDARALIDKRAAIFAHATQATGLVDDDPAGFRIGQAHLDHWLRPTETFHVTPRVVQRTRSTSMR